MRKQQQRLAAITALAKKTADRAAALQNDCMKLDLDLRLRLLAKGHGFTDGQFI